MILTDKHPEQGVRAEIGYLDPIEGLRGVAVSWVILFHYFYVRDPGAHDPAVAFIASRPMLDSIVRNGYLGVDLFFLITGFLLVLPWATPVYEGRAAPATRDFYVRRIRRIVPAYYMHLLLLLFLFIPLLRGFDYWRHDFWVVGYNAVAHALFLHYTTPISSASLSANGPLWSLAIEFQYYLLLPLLAPRIVRAPLRWAAILVAAAIAWRWLAIHDLAPLVALEMGIGSHWKTTEEGVRQLLATQLPAYMAHFAMGILAGIAWLRLRRKPPTKRSAAAWGAVVIGALAVMFWLYAAGGGAFTGSSTWLLTIAMMALVLFALASRSPALGNLLLGNRPLMGIGRISYSAYLYHLPLLLLWNHYGILDGRWLSLPAYLALVGAVAWTSYRFVELPGMHRRARAERVGVVGEPIRA